jgi:hypothetical protein
LVTIELQDAWNLVHVAQRSLDGLRSDALRHGVLTPSCEPDREILSAPRAREPGLPRD